MGFAKAPVEGRKISKTTFVSNFHDRHFGLDQEAANVTETDFGQELSKRLARCLFEKATEVGWRSVRLGGHHFVRQILIEMFEDELAGTSNAV